MPAFGYFHQMSTQMQANETHSEFSGADWWHSSSSIKIDSSAHSDTNRWVQLFLDKFLANSKISDDILCIKLYDRLDFQIDRQHLIIVAGL